LISHSHQDLPRNRNLTSRKHYLTINSEFKIWAVTCPFNTNHRFKLITLTLIINLSQLNVNTLIFLHCSSVRLCILGRKLEAFCESPCYHWYNVAWMNL
jgi:hypothetical protein